MIYINTNDIQRLFIPLPSGNDVSHPTINLTHTVELAGHDMDILEDWRVKDGYLVVDRVSRPMTAGEYEYAVTDAGVIIAKGIAVAEELPQADVNYEEEIEYTQYVSE